MIGTYPKPVPTLREAKAFWESCRLHEMRLQCCRACGRFRYPPRRICPACQSDAYGWELVSGQGRVYVSLVVYRSPSPAWDPEVPYNVSQIELEEGVRMWANVVGCDPGSVKIGDDVVLGYADVTDDITLPRFVVVRPG